MNILLFGARGFIGSHIAAALRARGHQLTTPNRTQANYRALDENALRPLLEGQDLVINAVGIMHRDAEALEQVHHHAPAQIATWARKAGVPRFLQLSALGADAAHPVAFVGSKGRGDQALIDSGLQVAIARPSLVYGRSGDSTEMFHKLAHLPVIPLPAGGRFELQAVCVEDVAQGIAALADNPPAHGTIIHMTGASVHTMAELITLIRTQHHGKNPPRILPIPLALLRPMLPLANLITNGVLSPGNIRLLEEGSTADNRDFAALLGHEPQSAKDFIRK